MSADPVSIYDIQSSTTDGDASIYDGQVVDTLGGVCASKFMGTLPRLMLQDTSRPDGWGAIQIKDWIYNSSTEEYELFDHVEIGDWIELTNVLVEESRGTTVLHYQAAYNPGYRIVSRNNALLEPIIVPVTAIPAPEFDPWDYGWYVVDHNAEPYESMRLIVRNVTVLENNLGKANDNYRLETLDGDACWAADYMNVDIGDWGYHPFIRLNQHFCALGGTFEQYTRISSYWDYYQLITMETTDLAICGDGDSDGDSDWDDLPRFHTCLTGPHCEGSANGCLPPAWHTLPMGRSIKHCLMMDMDYDGDVDLADFAGFQLVFKPE